MNKKQVIFIVGPTASGKSDVAVEVAERIGGEVISCDSMQVYKYMDIGTAKPSAEMLKRVKHHLVDIVLPCEEYSAARFAQEAKLIIKELCGKGKVPVVAGGSGLYMKALIEGVFDDSDKDEQLRENLRRRINSEGIDVVYKELVDADEEAARAIHPNDSRRLIRALEIFYKTGEKPSLIRKETKGIEDEYECIVFGLSRERAELYKRIEDRVDRMFEEGLIDEVKRVKKDFKISRTALCALGYKETMDYLSKNVHLSHLKYLVKRNSRRYAKRQLTWFRREPRLKWIEVSGDISASDTAQIICDKVTCGM